MILGYEEPRRCRDANQDRKDSAAYKEVLT